MIWEIGVLLAGIGVLILCIFTAVTIRDFGATAKRFERVMLDKNGEIQTIIDNSASISGNVDTITENAAKATNIVNVATSVFQAVRGIHNQEESGEQEHE